ncbi:hypothetical protein BC828DRAFT_395853 [Blastocladiella britannica]|nr:hypothetical protein BC828DRAFT_395853 [Blastocladiella britannica]
MTSLYHGHVAGHVLAYAGARCRTLDVALALMHVLPAFEQPSTVHAVLSREFRELAPKQALPLAVTYGHMSGVALYPKAAVEPVAWSLLETAAKVGNNDLIQKYLHAWIGKEHNGKDTKLFLLALKASHIVVLEWFRTHDRVHESIKECMAKKYSLACLKWAKTHDYLSIAADVLVIKGLAQNQLDTVEWATKDMSSSELLDMLNPNALVNHLSKLQCKCLDWWWAHGPQFPLPNDFCTIADNSQSLSHRPRSQCLSERRTSHVLDLSGPMVLHLVGLVSPNWVMGISADNGSTKDYAQEIYAAMLNFGPLKNCHLEKSCAAIAQEFMFLACLEGFSNMAECAWSPHGLPGDFSLELDQFLNEDELFNHFHSLQSLLVHIDTLWDIAKVIIGVRPWYLHDIVHSDFLKSIVIGYGQLSGQYYLNETAAVVTDLY